MISRNSSGERHSLWALPGPEWRATRSWQLVGLQLALYLTVAVYVAASMRSVPGGVYAAKWGALALLALATILASRGLRMTGIPVIVAFFPWFVLTLGYQVVIGPTPRGIGVAGGYLGLLFVTFLLLPSAVPTLTALDRFERWLIHALAIMCLLSVTMGLLDIGGSVVPSTVGRFRVRWAFTHVNTGGYLGYVGAVLCFRQLAFRRWRFLIPLILFAGLLVTSGSRGALLAFAAALAVAVVLRAVHRRAGLRVLVLSLTLTVVIFGALLPQFSSVLEVVSYQNLNQTTSGRIGAWRAALNELHTPIDWLVGNGAGQNINYVGARGAGVGGSSDSFIIDLITRSGLTGLLIWLGTITLIVAFTTVRFKQAIHQPEQWHLAFVIGLATSAIVAAGYEGFIFSVGSAYALMLWGCVGVAAISRQEPIPQTT